MLLQVSGGLFSGLSCTTFANCQFLTWQTLIANSLYKCEKLDLEDESWGWGAIFHRSDL